jgi:hypothetical protein
MLAMLAAGACRVGATATAAIGTDWRARGPEAVRAIIASAPSAKLAAGPSASDDE